MSPARSLTGALRHLRKGELVDLASQLGLETFPDALRPDYESLVSLHLARHRSLASDPRFARFYPPGPSKPSTSSPPPQSSNGRMPPKTPRSTRTSRRKSVGTASGDEEGVVAKAGEMVTRLEQEFESTLDRALVAVDMDAPQFGRLVRRSSRRVSQKLTEVGKDVGDVTVDGLVEAQHTLSSPWVLLSLGIFAELAYVLSSVTPLVQQSYGPVKWLLYNFTAPTARFAFRHPDLAVLFAKTFTYPLVTYAFLTLVIPLFLSLLISFPPLLPAGTNVLRSGRNYARLGGAKTALSPPNAFTFSVLRLAIVFLIHRVFYYAGPERVYAYGWEGGRFGLGGLAGVGMLGTKGLEALGEVQLVGCAVGVALTLYERLAA